MMATTQPLPTLVGRPAGLAGRLRGRLRRLLLALAERDRVARERRRLSSDSKSLADVSRRLEIAPKNEWI
jgi:hypothetical protein